MEHSALHALQLCGIVVALGGPILMLGILLPASRKLHWEKEPLSGELAASVSRWAFVGALLGALAALLNLFVGVAEVENKTVFGGVSIGIIWRFATVTVVGHLTLAKIAALLLAAVAVRLRGQTKWWLVGLFAFAAAFFTSMVSHAAAQPIGRTVAIFIQLAHITAAAAWLGVLIHLLFARKKIESAVDSKGANLIAEIVRRFSPIALGAVALLVSSGVIATMRYLVTPLAIPTSAYGLTLLVKLALLLPLLYAGYINHSIIRPELQTADLSDESRRSLLRRFGRTVELEVTAGVLVITVAGILASVSPPGEDGELRLTSAQAHALLSPDLPTTSIVNPEKFVGAAERTVDDLRYAEFTHNWSGVAVTLMGIFWLIQSLRGRWSGWVGKIWPFTFVPFAIFIAVAADPEVWILKTVSLAEAFANPALAQHQIGAILVLILAWLGWRDRHRPAESRPLGYALPVLMILGSLLLLGHAHSNLTSTQELTNFVNVQHAVFGAFGLFAGTVRWLSLRGLFRERIARVVWPGFVIGLGVFMTFFYREVV